jgi:hypothetical protein
MSTVRIPTGGARFRPCLADLAQMLVTQMGVDHLDTWETAVLANRRQYRATQVAAVVRAQPDLAVAELERIGYTVQPPADGRRQPHPEAIDKW